MWNPGASLCLSYFFTTFVFFAMYTTLYTYLWKMNMELPSPPLFQTQKLRIHYRLYYQLFSYYCNFRKHILNSYSELFYYWNKILWTTPSQIAILRCRQKYLLLYICTTTNYYSGKYTMYERKLDIFWLYKKSQPYIHIIVSVFQRTTCANTPSHGND